MIFVTKLSDKRRWAGSDQWHYIRRQLWSVSHETTCYNKTPQTQQYFRAKKTKLLSRFERERRELYPSFSWLEWAVGAVTSAGRGAAVSQPTFHLFWRQQELTTTSNWGTKTFQSFSHNVLSKAQFPSHFSLFENSPKGCNWSSLSQWQQQPSNEPVGVIPISSDLKTVWD